MVFRICFIFNSITDGHTPMHATNNCLWKQHMAALQDWTDWEVSSLVWVPFRGQLHEGFSVSSIKWWNLRRGPHGLFASYSSFLPWSGNIGLSGKSNGKLSSQNLWYTHNHTISLCAVNNNIMTLSAPTLPPTCFCCVSRVEMCRMIKPSLQHHIHVNKAKISTSVVCRVLPLYCFLWGIFHPNVCDWSEWGC